MSGGLKKKIRNSSRDHILTKLHVAFDATVIFGHLSDDINMYFVNYISLLTVSYKFVTF